MWLAGLPAALLLSVALPARWSGNALTESETERGEALHFKLSRALGIVVPGLLGSALAVGAAALPANAQTYQDTALSATAVSPATFGGSGLTAANGTDKKTITLSGINVTWSLH